MNKPMYLSLEGRGLLAVSGDDATDFLQGLISNDMTRVSPARAIYGALLTAQGKFLHDFFVLSLEDQILLDCEGSRLEDLMRRLNMYKLRARVEIADRSNDFTVAAVFGDGVDKTLGLTDEPGAAGTFADGIAYMDPRLAAMGARVVTPDTAALTKSGCEEAEPEDYERLRLKLGLADGSRDMVVEKAILLENGFEELHGVDWDKGCYTGQELTARTHYRGLIKKRLMPVRIVGPLPEPGTQIMLGDAAAGEMRSGAGDRGLALIRLEHFRAAVAEGTPMNAGEASLVPKQPDWAVFPDPA